jgi:hypothetical protein
MWPAALAGIVWLIALSGAAPAGAAAQSGAGSAECCPELLLRIGARALGLGGAITARSDASSVFINPALIANVDSDQFLVHNSSSSLDDSNTFTILIRSQVIGSLAASYRLVDYGEQPITTDPNQPPSGNVRVLAHVLTATYATEVAAGWAAGVSYKLFQFRNDCSGNCQEVELTATTHSLDAGVQFVPRPLPELNLGASLIHAGFPLQFRNAEQADPPPVRARVGAAYEVAHHIRSDTTVAWWLSADLVTSPRNGDVHVNVGSELSLDQTLFLYLGYGGGPGVTGGAGAGAGLRYDRFDIRIAKSFNTSPLDESGPVQITFAIRF